MAKQEIVWESTGVNQLRFTEPGQEFEGYLLQIDSGPGFDDQLRWMYNFKNDEGHWILYGTTVLNRILQNGDVGAYYKITYTGDRKTERGFMVKEYDVLKAAGLHLDPEDLPVPYIPAEDSEE
tara:strand:+ start:151 stop:519 length:369 start_codon:yes stop_codon:yes gene_type:complete